MAFRPAGDVCSAWNYRNRTAHNGSVCRRGVAKPLLPLSSSKFQHEAWRCKLWFLSSIRPVHWLPPPVSFDVLLCSVQSGFCSIRLSHQRCLWYQKWDVDPFLWLKTGYNLSVAAGYRSSCRWNPGLSPFTNKEFSQLLLPMFGEGKSETVFKSNQL